MLPLPASLECCETDTQNALAAHECTIENAAGCRAGAPRTRPRTGADRPAPSQPAAAGLTGGLPRAGERHGRGLPLTERPDDEGQRIGSSNSRGQPRAAERANQAFWVEIAAESERSHVPPDTFVRKFHMRLYAGLSNARSSQRATLGCGEKSSREIFPHARIDATLRSATVKLSPVRCSRPLKA